MFSSILVFSFLALSVFAVPGLPVAAGGKCIKGKAVCGGSLQCYDLTDPLLPKPSKTGSGTCVNVVSNAGDNCTKDKAVCGGSLQCYEFPRNTRLPEPSKTGSGTCVNVVSNAGDKCTKGKAACGGSLQCYNLTDPLLPKLSEPGSRTGTCVTVVSTTGGACIANQAVCGDTLQCYSNDTTSILSKDGTCKIVRQLKDKCTLDNHDVCQNDEKTKLECYGSLLKKNGSGFCTAVSILGQSCDKWSKCKNEGNPDDSECYENGKQTTCEGTCVNLSKNAGDQCSSIVKCAANDESTGYPMSCENINFAGIGNCHSVSTLGQSCNEWSKCKNEGNPDTDSECYENGRLTKGAGTCVNLSNYAGDQCSNIVKCAANYESTGYPMYCKTRSNNTGFCETVYAPLGSSCLNGNCNVNEQKLSCYFKYLYSWLDWRPEAFHLLDSNKGRCFGKEGSKPGNGCSKEKVNECSVGLSCITSKKVCDRDSGCDVCLEKDSFFDECKNDTDCGLGLVCNSHLKRCLFIDQNDGNT